MPSEMKTSGFGEFGHRCFASERARLMGLLCLLTPPSWNVPSPSISIVGKRLSVVSLCQLRNEHLNTYDGAADVARALGSVRQRFLQAGVWVTHTCHTFGSVSLSGRSLPYALNLLACLSICEPQMTNQALLYVALTHYSW